MSIKLNGITLPSDMVLENLHSSSPITASAEKALDGSDVLFLQSDGRALDLVATENSGWIDLATIKQLEGLVANMQGEMLLEYFGQTFTVRFRYEDAPVLEFTPLIARPNEADTDLFYGTIKLKEV